MKTIAYKSLDELDTVAKELIQFAADSRIWVFEGPLGAGKTTFIKAIAKRFGVEERVSSPTFSLVNEYRNPSGEPFFHFDFYRIEDPSEVIEIGVDEYFYSGNYCWIEWAEKIPGYVPEDFIHINIESKDDGTRVITFNEVKNGQADG